jgi:hypothetical protein
MSEKKLLVSVVASIVVMSLLSFGVTGTIWPWGLLQHHSILVRIVGWIFVVQLASTPFALLFVRSMNRKTCPICSRNLGRFADAQGGITLCKQCGTPMHVYCLKGKNGRCPICHPASVGQSNIDLDFARDADWISRGYHDR